MSEETFEALLTPDLQVPDPTPAPLVLFERIEAAERLRACMAPACLPGTRPDNSIVVRAPPSETLAEKSSMA